MQKDLCWATRQSLPYQVLRDYAADAMLKSVDGFTGIT